jgi:hypothetical protein
MRLSIPEHRLLARAAAALLIASSGCAGAAGGSAELSWAAPTHNTDGTALGELTGYTIYYGTQPDALAQRIELADPTATHYVVRHLAPGTWYFSVAARTASGESSRTPVVSKTIGH